MNDFIRIDEGNTSFFINKTNIAGVSIDKTQPHRLCVLMIGDTIPTEFTFSNVQERNDKLTEILRTEGYAIPKDTDPHTSEE